MKSIKVVLIATVAIVTLFSGLGQNAYASHSKRNGSVPRAHYRIKKNDGPFGGKYMKPKKQKRPTGYYRSTLNGRTVYGNPK